MGVLLTRSDEVPLYTGDNSDAAGIPPDSVYTGNSLGFRGSLEAAWEAGTKADSAFSLEVTFDRTVQEQNNRIRAAGLEPPPSLTKGNLQRQFKRGYYGEYFDAAKYYTDGRLPADDPEFLQSIYAYDKQIDSLRGARPDLKNLKTHRELWEESQQRNQLASTVWEKSTTTPMGKVGGFIGNTATVLDFPVSPLNTLSLGVQGGAGLLGRMAVQSVAQGAAESINQLTGMQEKRRLMGLESYGQGRALLDITGATVGGAALQGAGEVLGFGLRQVAKRAGWFTHAPEVGDPAPAIVDPRTHVRPEDIPPPPAHATPEEFAAWKAASDVNLTFHIPEAYGRSGVGRLRAAQDLTAVEQQLQDWDGPDALDAQPHVEWPDSFLGKPITEEEYARQIDPVVFRQWDKLTTEAEMLRTNMRQAELSRSEAPVRTQEERVAAQAARTIEDQIATLEQQATGLKNRKQLARIRDELDTLRQQRQAQLPQVSMPGTAGAYRTRLLDAEADIRELKPVVDRARAAARGDWASISAKAEAGMEPVGREALSPGNRYKMRTAPSQVIKTPTRGTPVEQVIPMLNRRSDVVSKLPHDADAADKIAAIRSEDAKIEEKATEDFIAKVAEVMKPIEPIDVKAAKPPVVIGQKELTAAASELKGVNMGKAGDFLAQQAQTALAAGRSVNLIIEGKAHKITSVERGMITDDEGQSWGSMHILSQKPGEVNRLEIIDDPAFKNINGRMVHLDNDFIAHPDGRLDANNQPEMISIRAFMKEVQMDQDMLKAVGTCSSG